MSQELCCLLAKMFFESQIIGILYIKPTRTTFHSNSKTFFIGKWGAVPLQNFVTIPNKIIVKLSSPPIGSPGI